MDNEVFRALADSSRRTLLDRLFERDGQTLGELEAALPAMTRFGVMKHLRVLEAARLVTSRKVGRERHHYLNPVPIRQLHDRWLDRYRIRAADLLDDLRTTLEDTPMTTPDAPVATAPKYVFATYIRATPELIWRALTESEFTTRYWYGSSIQSDWQRGSRYEVQSGGNPVIDGEILEADPPRRLAMTFHDLWSNPEKIGALAKVTFEIEDTPHGVSKLTVIHEDVEGHDSRIAQVSDGWPFILSGLKTLLETGETLDAAQPATATAS